MNQVNCEEIIEKLREGPPNKVDLWNELKVLVFTKVSLLIYAGTLLVIAIRIQLNIIGGHIYCNTLVSEGDFKITSSLQEKYLSLCNYFLDNGVLELCTLVKEKVNLALKDVTLKQSMNLQDIEKIFWAIQTSINNDSRNPLKIMSDLIYGQDLKIENVLIKEMMMDTVDLLQSTEVFDIAKSCVSRGFSRAVDSISEFFLPKLNHMVSYPSTSKEVSSRFAQPTNIAKPFAKIIPIVSGFGNASDSNESWISPFIYMNEVKMLGANIYESYSCKK